MASNELTNIRIPVISENGFERQSETMTLENSTSTYLQTQNEQSNRLIENEESVSSRDNVISDLFKHSSATVLSCILCMECIGDRNALQHHLIKNHEVKTEALHAFMALVDFNDRDAFQTTEQIEDGKHEKFSDSVAEVKGRPKLTPSTPSPNEESDNLIIDLGNNGESVEESAAVTDVEVHPLGENERFVGENNEGGMSCNICSAAFPDCDFLFKHQDEAGHLSVRQTSTGPCYVCWDAKCDKTFPTTRVLRCHFVNMHVKGHRTLTSGSTESEEFRCRQCNQVFRKKEEFKMHCYCHKMERAMECCNCGIRFNSIHEFRRHKQTVHNEELTSEQQELYEASIAAASSLALLGASGLEYMTNHTPKASNCSSGKAKDVQNGENGLVVPEITMETSTVEERVGSRLDENSNSCLQSKFGGLKGNDGLAEDILQKNGEKLNCSHNGLLYNKCSSCKIGLNKATEKHKRKRSHPSKVISDLSKQMPLGDISSSEMSKFITKETSVLDVSANVDKNTPSTISVALTDPLPSALTNSIPTVSPSGRLPHPSRPVDRPYRCSLCKVSYTQKTQLDSHLVSQQHLSRCAKVSDPLIRQTASTTIQMTSPFAVNTAEQINQFAELMRQQKVPIPSFLPFGVPFLNPLMSPLLTNCCVMPPVTAPSLEAEAHSTPFIAKHAAVVGKDPNYQKVELKSEPVSNIDPTSKLSPCDDVDQKTDLSCAKCCETFSSAEHLNRHQREAECMEAARNILAPELRSNKCNQTMMESILQRIGYECVKQFNEYRQKPKHVNSCSSNADFVEKAADDSRSKSKEHTRRNSEVLDCSGVAQENLNEYFCWTCSKSFSSIFVLKAHQEQIHREVVPIDVIEKIHNELKVNYEKNCKNEESKVTSERSSTSGEKRRQELTAVRQPNIEEEMKMKHQQQLQLAAAFQNMQLNIMMSMGMLPQVFPRLPGSAHISSLPSELFSPQPYQMMDPMLMLQLRQQQCKSTPSMPLPMSSPSQLSSTPGPNQKSARTRISEQQLQILRANFDINNSPNEEQIQEMSEKTGLAMKVIKHWFRNTLFKERQRNKDSPYNFNVPPATILNLEDCEQTQKASIIKEMSPSSDDNGSAASSINCDIQLESQTNSVAAELADKSEMTNDSAMVNIEKAGSSKMPLIAENKMTMAQCSSQANTEFKLIDMQHGINLNAVMNNFYGLAPAISLQERRAGRTRFSNHQNQVLQEFFDRNPYPKDDEVEVLSRALNLRVRVIVVWFQNARQRVRKTEIHPSSVEGAKLGQFQCGRCAITFDQQIDLLRHQVAEHSTGKDFNCGTSSSNEVFVDEEEQGSRSSLSIEPDYDGEGHRNSGGAKTECDVTFEFTDQLNENQRMAQSQNPSTLQHSSGIARQMFDCSQNVAELERRMSEDGTIFRQSSDDEEHRADRRMRTTLAQDQLDYLYQKFAVESNPSRPVLESIAGHLNLKPRVVQVWFQNTRARERRGQHRVNSQKSLIRCSFCSSMFRGKVALDAHMAEQHQSINNLAYPVDLVRKVQDVSPGMESVTPPFLTTNSLMNTPGISALQTNMHYLYEKSFQQYMSKLTNLHAAPQLPPSLSSNQSSIHSAPTTKPSKQAVTKADDVPLDLTISGISVRNDPMKTETVDTPHASLYPQNLDDSFSETYSENDENGMGGVDNMSPSAIGSSSSHNSAMFGAGKRYRTQMSSVQIKVMRAIFSSYKTPSLAECDILGQQIGLGKRVVQVWFQNSRAKEKKASFPSDGSDTNGNGLFPQLSNMPTECRLCTVTYSVNHTLQDHLFTKMHIDRIKAVVNTNDFGKSFPNSVIFGESDSLDQHKMPSMSFLPLIKSMTNSPTVISTKTLESTGNMHNNNNYNHSARTVSAERKNKRLHETPVKVARDQPNDPGKNIPNNVPILSSAMRFVNPLDASLRQFMGIPPADLMAVMMPYLYPGGALPSVFPGLNPIQRLSQTPGVLPDLANALFSSAAMCGIQLFQLQIPKRAIEQIQARLKDKTCVTANYSEDCLSSAEVKSHLTSEEFVLLVEKTIHVGFICKKCHMVFPQVDACNAHQVTLCYKDFDCSTGFGDLVLKLEQRLYQCSQCKVNCSTVKEFKGHCAQEKHSKGTSSEVAGDISSRNNSAILGIGTLQQHMEKVASKEISSAAGADIKLETEDG